MNRKKLIKFVIATILFLVSIVAPDMAANAVNYSYSGKTHKITFSVDATGFKKLIVKYDGKAVKAAKVKGNGKFKVTVPFKGYKTFKLYGDKQLLKTISAKKYVT